MVYSITLTKEQKKGLRPLIEKGYDMLHGLEVFVITGQLLLPDSTGRALVPEIHLTMLTGDNAISYYKGFKNHLLNEKDKQEDK